MTEPSTPTDDGETPAPGRWLDADEAASYMRVSLRTLQRHGRTAVRRFGGRTLYDRDVLDGLPQAPDSED